MSATSKTVPCIVVGTYTEFEGSQSEGIYVYRMDASSGQLTFDQVVKGIINPSFLEIHPERHFIYAVNEVQSYDGAAGGGVGAFSMENNNVRLLNSQLSQGSDPCYISIEQTGRFGPRQAHYLSIGPGKRQIT